MLLSINWLKKYVNLPEAEGPSDVAAKLTAHVAEAEGVTHFDRHITQVVTGKILSFTKHPNADDLNVAKIDVGKRGVLQIIFGSRFTATEGMIVPIALVGASLPVGLIEKRQLRGIESYGMVCADEEMEIPFSRSGFTLFQEGTPLGVPIAELLELKDNVIEFSNTALTNRPDLFSHIGFAREAAAIYKKPLQLPKLPPVKASKDGQKVAVTIKEKKLCRAYQAVRIDHVAVTESPAWLKAALLRCGMRPINVIVDLTNYVLLEYGQPLHAFDAQKITQPITIRAAKVNEKITTLDGVERTLDAGTLVIADAVEAQAIAGIMGGAVAEVGDNTNSIILESANFDPVAIRRASQKLGLRTEASLRDEKGIDPALTLEGMERFVQLLGELQPNVIVGKPFTTRLAYKAATITVPFSLLDARIGVAIPHDEICDSLERLGFGIRKSKTTLKLTVPRWRAKDVTTPEDIVEEVARSYGYDRIPVVRDGVQVETGSANHFSDLLSQTKDVLVGLGLDEVLSYSFVSARTIQALGLHVDDHHKIQKPLSQDWEFLRTTIVPGLLERLAKNLRLESPLALFEIERIFEKRAGTEPVDGGHKGTLPVQDFYLGVAVSAMEKRSPIFAAKGIVEQYLGSLHLAPEIRNTTNTKPYMHPVRAASISVHGEQLGWLFELHPQVAKRFGFRERVACIELNFSKLANAVPEPLRYHPLPKFPQVTRDVAIVVSEDVVAADITAFIRNADDLVVDAIVFDVFRSEELGKQSKSVALRITYAKTDRTLTSGEVEMAQKKIEDALSTEFGAVKRTA